jgi:hypothetical protein
MKRYSAFIFAAILSANAMEIEKAGVCTVKTSDNEIMSVPVDLISKFKTIRMMLGDFPLDQLSTQEIRIPVNQDIFKVLLQLVEMDERNRRNLFDDHSSYEKLFSVDDPQSLIRAAHVLNAINALEGPRSLFKTMLVLIARKLNAMKFDSNTLALLKELDDILPGELHQLVNSVFLIKFQHVSKIMHRTHKISSSGNHPLTKFSPDGRFLLWDSLLDFPKSLWDVSHNPAQRFDYRIGYYAKFSADGNYACVSKHNPITASTDTCIYALINLITREHREFEVPRTQSPPSFSPDSRLLIFEDWAFSLDSHQTVPITSAPISKSSKLEAALAQKYEPSQIRQIVLQLPFKAESIRQVELHGRYLYLISPDTTTRPFTNEFSLFEILPNCSVKKVMSHCYIDRFNVGSDKKNLLLVNKTGLEFVDMEFLQWSFNTELFDDFTERRIASLKLSRYTSCGYLPDGKKVLILYKNGNLEMHIYVPCLAEYISNKLQHPFTRQHVQEKSSTYKYNQTKLPGYDELTRVELASSNDERMVLHRKDVANNDSYIELYDVPIQLCTTKCTISELVALIAILGDQKIGEDLTVEAFYQQLQPEIQMLIEAKRLESTQQSASC